MYILNLFSQSTFRLGDTLHVLLCISKIQNFNLIILLAVWRHTSFHGGSMLLVHHHTCTSCSIHVIHPRQVPILSFIARSLNLFLIMIFARRFNLYAMGKLNFVKDIIHSLDRILNI